MAFNGSNGTAIADYIDSELMSYYPGGSAFVVSETSTSLVLGVKYSATSPPQTKTCGEGGGVLFIWGDFFSGEPGFCWHEDSGFIGRNTREVASASEVAELRSRIETLETGQTDSM